MPGSAIVWQVDKDAKKLAFGYCKRHALSSNTVRHLHRRIAIRQLRPAEAEETLFLLFPVTISDTPFLLWSTQRPVTPTHLRVRTVLLVGREAESNARHRPPIQPREGLEQLHLRVPAPPKRARHAEAGQNSCPHVDDGALACPDARRLTQKGPYIMFPRSAP